MKAALSELERGNDYLRREQAMAEGYIDLGMVTSVEYDMVPQWIKSFQEFTGKKAFFSCKTGTSRQLANGLKDNRFDLIFCTAIPSEPQIEFIPVFEQLLVAAVPASHRFARRKSIHIRELEPENIIIHTRSSSMWDITNQIYREAGIGCAVMTDNPELHTDGVALIPLTGVSFKRYISMGYRKEQARPYMAELFWRHIMDTVLPL